MRIAGTTKSFHWRAIPAMARNRASVSGMSIKASFRAWWSWRNFNAAPSVSGSSSVTETNRTSFPKAPSRSCSGPNISTQGTHQVAQKSSTRTCFSALASAISRRRPSRSIRSSFSPFGWVVTAAVGAFAGGAACSPHPARAVTRIVSNANRPVIFEFLTATLVDAPSLRCDVNGPGVLLP